MAGLALMVLSQGIPTVDPSSIYGMKTFTTNEKFGFLPEKIALGFAPTELDGITMHVMKGTSELTKGGFYGTETPYPSFRMLRYIPEPVVNLPDAGAYTIEFRQNGTPFSKFPFEVRKKSGGDEFNPTTSWQFVTPVDKSGFLAYSASEDTNVWLHFWMAPDRESIPKNSMVEVKLMSGGKVVAHALPHKVQETHNIKHTFKLMKPEGQGRAAFTKSHLNALGSGVTAVVTNSGKEIRKFNWKVSDGKVELHPRSKSDHSPRTDYWIPRRLAGSPEGYQFFHLQELYWATSQ